MSFYRCVVSIDPIFYIVTVIVLKNKYVLLKDILPSDVYASVRQWLIYLEDIIEVVLVL